MSDHRPSDIGRSEEQILDAIADLLRLPPDDWRIDGSRLQFLYDLYDIVKEVRDMSVGPSDEVLRQYGLTYDPQTRTFKNADGSLDSSTTCDFCDRLFHLDDSGHYPGLSSRAFGADLDDPGWTLAQDVCDLCIKEHLPGIWPELLGE
jgi:hypothetical protein